MKETPDWLITDKAVPIMKDREKGNDVTNFRPITCLSLMWIFTGILSDELYCMTIWKVRDSCQTNEMGAKENRGGQRTNY